MNADLDVTRIAQNFAKAHATYGKSAVIQQQMCHTLMDMLPPIQPKSVLEIGCGVGNLTDIYVARWQPERLYLNDLYDISPRHHATLLIGDIETLSLPQVDVVLSGSALQWIKDLSALFDKVHHALSDGGVFAFSTFGCDNLYQIKDLTGVGLDYHHKDDLIVMLQQTGFYVQNSHQSRQTLYFDHPKAVLRHIQDTGVAVGTKRWTKSSLQAFYEDYHAKYGTPQGHALTYDPIFVVAQKR